MISLNEFAVVANLTTKREIETKGKEYLLQHLAGAKACIYYNDKGKPYLTNDTRHISLSHSHDKLVIILNEKEETGIDIELIRDKVLKIKHKYLTEHELIAADNDVEKLLIYWAAKETLYKIYGLKDVDFVEHLIVKSFDKEKAGMLIGEINLPNFNNSFNLYYKILNDYVMVYALNKITDC